MKARLLLLSLFFVSLLVACSDDPGTEESTTASIPVRTKTPTPRNTPVNGSLPSPLDAIINEVLSNNVASIAARVELERLPCVAVEQVGSPPLCPDGAEPGTLVEVFPVTICERTWVAASDVEERINRLLSEMPGLYAVTQSDDAQGRIYRTVFITSSATGFWLTTRGDVIEDIAGPCGPIGEAVIDDLGTVIARPDE